MKNTMKMMLALMIGASAAVSCQKEMPFEENNTKPEAKKILSITAGTEGNTKTTIDYSAGLYKVNWCAGDAILLSDGTNAGKYTLTSGEGSGVGFFEFANDGEAVTEGNSIYAFYPSAGPSFIVTSEYIADILGAMSAAIISEYKNQIKAFISEGIFSPEEGYAMLEEAFVDMGLEGAMLDMVMAYCKDVPYATQPSVSYDIVSNISIPDYQVVANGECVDPSTMLMVAKSDDGKTLNFKNLCSYVKITLDNPCMKVTITSRGGEFIVGNYIADFSGSSNPVISCESGSDTVTLTAAEGELAAGTYYIAVGVSALQNGLSIKYYNTTDGCFKASVLTTSFDFARNNVYNGSRDTEASEDGALWTIAYSEAEREEIKNNVVKVVFTTGKDVSSKPAGATILGVGTSIWSYIDSENVLHIETPASKIWGKERKMNFESFYKVKEYVGMTNVDVTELHNLFYLFRDNLDLQTLDLSSWNFVKITAAQHTFVQDQSLTSLKLNDTFDISDVYDLEWLVHNVGVDSGMCVISGITNNNIKAAFKDATGRGTGWKDSRMMFDND